MEVLPRVVVADPPPPLPDPLTGATLWGNKGGGGAGKHTEGWGTASGTSRTQSSSTPVVSAAASMECCVTSGWPAFF